MREERRWLSPGTLERLDLSRQTAVAAVAAVALTGIVLWLDGPGPSFSLQEMPVWLVLLTIALLALGARGVPSLAWAWWLFGLLTLTWSLAPADTAVTLPWLALYLVAFVAGRWRWGFLLITLPVVLTGLLDNLLLSTLVGPMFSSGSSFYVLGAQAASLLALALAVCTRRHALWFTFPLLVASLYAVGMSGARAALLPAAMALGLTVWRLWREQPGPRAVLTLGAAILAVGVLDTVLPSHPVMTALLRKGTVAEQLAATESGGNFQTRLQFWEVSARMGLEHPLGTGAGTYASVAQGFHDWPIYFSRFPHNGYAETFATGGTIWLALLLALVVPILWRGWRSTAWPWALTAGALWINIAFDITFDMPVVMVLAFGALGAVQSRLVAPGERAMPWPTRVLPPLSLALLIGLSARVAWPCTTVDCRLQQQFYRQADVTEAIRRFPERREVLLARAARVNPGSLWVDQLAVRTARSTQERERRLERLIERFPAASMWAYLELARVLESRGDVQGSREAIRRGLAVFDRVRTPLGLSTVISGENEQWVREARERLTSAP